MEPKNCENFEEIFYNILAEGHRPEAAYDHLVVFSGGKDSTYMAHKLRQAKGGRVCLFCVDNGFEENSYIDHLKKAASQLQMDLYIYAPPIGEFIVYYNFLIQEDLMKSFDSNPLCFFCARYFMALGQEFADRLNIPFVSYGATPMQLTGNKLARNLKDIELYEPATKMVRESMYRKIKGLEAYKGNPVLKKIIDRVFYSPKNTKLIFPFQYVEYNIGNIIKTLETEYDWQPPAKETSKGEYLTSGCELLDFVYAITEKRGFTMHELPQLEHDYAQGIMTQTAYDYNKKRFQSMLTQSPTPEIKKVAKVLGVENLL